MLNNEVVDLNKKGLVFDIQRFSVHDGPGIRTIVFLKGCPLSCRWCSNPESQCKDPQVMFVPKKCIGCGKCKEVCPVNAVDFELPSRIHQSKCIKCGRCVENCYANALEMSGIKRTVGEVINELKKDNMYYRRSGGGITLSGGEALIQADFAEQLLKGCKVNGWNTAVETAAFVSRNILKRLLPSLDLVLMDIKHMDSKKHEEFIGQGNEIILENAKFIARSGTRLIIRVPVIPGFNDDEYNISRLSRFVVSLKNVKEIHLLPYHKLGENKYNYLGYKYKMPPIDPPSSEEMDRLKDIVEKFGLVCKIGGVS